MSDPLIVDLCGGAGAAAGGYMRAGFRVLGIDIAPQLNYPGPFMQADITNAPIAEIIEVSGAVAVHFSPPCQKWSRLAYYQPELIDDKYPDLIGPGREMLLAVQARLGIPFVIENVPQAPLINPVLLCGTMFPDLKVWRHRHFEAHGFTITQPPHLPPADHPKCIRNGYLPTAERPFMSIHGGKHSRAWQRKACEVMGAPWMIARPGPEALKAGIAEVSEAIPVQYTEYVGLELMDALSPEQVAAA
jgi:DNA (cytosine-5)-methyltransferase 1